MMPLEPYEKNQLRLWAIAILIIVVAIVLKAVLP